MDINKQSDQANSPPPQQNNTPNSSLPIPTPQQPSQEPVSPISTIQQSSGSASFAASSPSPVVPNPASNIPPIEQSSSSSQSAGGKKLNMLIVSLVVLFVGVLTGVSLFAAGFFQSNMLRLGESTSEEQGQPAPHQKIVVGTDATYPPMEFKDENGNLIGLDIDLGKKIAEEINAEIEYKSLKWDDLFTALERREIDAIISSVTITEERKTKYAFSEPYFNAGQVIVTDKNGVVTKPEQLRGKRVGVQRKTTSEEEAVRYAGEVGTVRYEDYTEAVASMSAGSIDAIIVDLTAAKGLVDKHQNLKIASDPFTNEYYGIVMRKDSADLQEQFNAAIVSLKQRGIIDNIRQKWFQ